MMTSPSHPDRGPAQTLGEADALNPLIAGLYEHLHRLARDALRHERPDHTLQTTALVHEAYLHLLRQNQVTWENRAQVLGLAATLMRRILVDHARRHMSQKRGGDRVRMELEDAPAERPETEVDVAALDEAIERLATLDARAARIVELRFFAALGVEETAQVLEISPATVKREWAMAKAWLRRELKTP